MLNMNVTLGREVATTTEILQVIRPELRLMRYTYRGMIDAMREGWLDANPDLEHNDGADEAAFGSLFDHLQERARTSVRQWAKDVEKVFDGATANEFIRQCLISAMSLRDGEDPLPKDALDY